MSSRRIGGIMYVTEFHIENGEWSAINDDCYDGPESPIGWGKTEAEAITDLQEKYRERAS